MQKTRKEHLNNILLAGLNIATLTIAGFLLEYEVAKTRQPDLLWVGTSTTVNYAVAGMMIVASLLVLAILALIYRKSLYNRPYLWWMTGFSVVVGLTMLWINVRAAGFIPFIRFVLFP